MQASPFPHYGPLDPDEVRGRSAILTDLVERVTERRPTALLGPRRFGKTSLLARLGRDLSEVTTVSIDLFGATSWADLATRFVQGIDEAGSAVRDPATDLALTAGVDLGVVRATVSRTSARTATDDKNAFHGIVEALAKTAENVPVLLLLDEFQSVAAVDGAAAVLRTVLQRRYRKVGLVFAGSAPSAMQQLFAAPDQPFYNQVDVLHLPPLDEEAVNRVIAHGYAATGRDPGALSSLVWAYAQGHPQRTMLCADTAWRLSHDRDGGVAWPEAVRTLRRSKSSEAERVYAALSPSEQKVVRLFANRAPLYGNAADRIGLTAGTATHAKNALLADGTLFDLDGEVRVTDPVVADWARLKLPV